MAQYLAATLRAGSHGRWLLLVFTTYCGDWRLGGMSRRCFTHDDVCALGDLVEVAIMSGTDVRPGVGAGRRC